MKIKKITLHKVNIPMKHPFTTAFGTITQRPTVIVELQTHEGITGYGEAPALPFPMYKPDTTDICMLTIRDYIAPLVLNQEFPNVESLMNHLKIIKQHTFSKAGIETAFLMARLIQENKSLTNMIGGTQTKIPVGESIGLKPTIQETLDEITLRYNQGFQRIKIKVAPQKDLLILEAIRNKFNDIPLAVDGNSAYTLNDINILKQFDNYNLTMIEQPLADDDIIDHAVLQKQLQTPICLDESILSAQDARKAISIGACKMINIKPGRVGGIWESKKIHDICQANNIGVWCGGMLESGIGRAFNIGVASLPGAIYPADMSPSNFYYTDDLVDHSYKVDNQGYITVPQTNGLGFKINQKKLKKYTSEKITIN